MAVTSRCWSTARTPGSVTGRSPVCRARYLRELMPQDGALARATALFVRLGGAHPGLGRSAAHRRADIMETPSAASHG